LRNPLQKEFCAALKCYESCHQCKRHAKCKGVFKQEFGDFNSSFLAFVEGCTNPSILCTISTLQHPHEQTISINSVHNFNLAISSSYWDRPSSLHITCTVLLSLIVVVCWILFFLFDKSMVCVVRKGEAILQDKKKVLNKGTKYGKRAKAMERKDGLKPPKISSRIAVRNLASSSR
jgi:hypothetical protein